MHRERLEILKKHLETSVAPAHLNVAYWGYDKDGVFHGCIAGHAAKIPEFAAQGLELRRGGLSDVYTIAYGDALGYTAAKNFFELSSDDTAWLFFPQKPDEGKLITPQIMAARIGELLARPE